MGSMAIEDVPSIGSVAPKSEPVPDDHSPSSSSSIGDIEPTSAATDAPNDPPPPPKRKGGRKPIYATSEERKQRNRQAQAAFRERRTEYIKQLETTIQHHEENLQNLQQSHRTAADECLMLRYKNSLLERILLEKGIDVQAELRLKGSPHLRPTRPGLVGQSSALQKSMLSRQQQQQHARQRSMVAPSIQTANATATALSRPGAQFQDSLTGQPTPPSLQASPSTMRSPNFVVSNGVTSPTQDVLVPLAPAQSAQRTFNPAAQPGHLVQQPTPRMTNPATPTTQSLGPHSRQASSGQRVAPSVYPTLFQKHYDQLDQEFDAGPDILDDVDEEDVDADSFIPNFRLASAGGHPPISMQASPPTTASATSDHGGLGTLPFEYDPMLDADPFGLSASMHFPNPYSFTAPQQRR